ncbi:Hint domain-containing protein [Pseudaestuariivita rosea]|uniref:Hint domain-containing protein n=1 Tax=Pseudaestuariivita rosea TaxID=2763263 RepID=UPI001ABAF64C|nr:Hint domain-containing protein [Pseudaestuariivita rosea]
MAVLYFTGDQVAFFGGINDKGTATEFTGVNAPFLSTDIVEINVPDKYILPDGSFDPNEVQFTSVTVERDGTRYEFDVDTGSKIKETGGSEIPEAGDTFFITNDSVGAPASGPFAGLPTEKMVFSTDSTFSSGQTTTIDRTTSTDLNNDGDTNDAGEAADAQFNANQANMPPCYAPGTLIATTKGPRPVETIQPGDLVLTRDHGVQSVLWCRNGAQALDGIQQESRPVLVQKGSLGPNRPSRDLIVSPQHRILVGGEQQLHTVFNREVFVPAKALTSLPGIRHMMGRKEINWVHFVCEKHEVIRANGCWSESLLLGPMAQRSLTLSDRRLLAAALPPSANPDYMNGPPALPCLPAGVVRRILIPAKMRLRAVA